VIEVLVVLVVVGICWWLLDTYVPIAEPIKTIIRIVLVLFLIVWLLSVFGIVNVPLRLR
jgi:hypothetical protein